MSVWVVTIIQDVDDLNRLLALFSIIMYVYVMIKRFSLEFLSDFHAESDFFPPILFYVLMFHSNSMPWLKPLRRFWFEIVLPFDDIRLVHTERQLYPFKIKNKILSQIPFSWCHSNQIFTLNPMSFIEPVKMVFQPAFLKSHGKPRNRSPLVFSFLNRFSHPFSRAVPCLALAIVSDH